MLNKVMIIGNLGKDPESKFLANGDELVTFSVATSERWKNKQTGAQEESTEWFNIVAFRQLAGICSKYLRKGSKVYIDGKMKTRSWQKDDGSTAYRTELIASEMKMLGDAQASQGAAQQTGTQQGQSRRQSSQGTTQAASQPPPNYGQGKPDFGEFEDDIPF